MKKKLTISLGADSNDEIVSRVKNFLISKKIALDVQNKRANLGIIFCYTGTGVTIVANRFKGIRATLCNNEEIAICAKKWNDSNILTMGLMSVDRERIENIVLSWINTEVDIEEIENIRGIDDLK